MRSASEAVEDEVKKRVHHTCCWYRDPLEMEKAGSKLTHSRPIKK